MRKIFRSTQPPTGTNDEIGKRIRMNQNERLSSLPFPSTNASDPTEQRARRRQQRRREKSHTPQDFLSPTTAMSTRRTPMPLLIDAFPTPPSHIPLTPTTLASNPPPSRPPSVPLPPVPGPSRITEADTLQLLLVSNRSTKSRRSSKYSLSPTDGNRDSVLSTSSSGHGVASSPPPNATRQRQRTSLPSSPTPMNRPSIAFSIDEEDEHASTRPLVLRDVVSPMLPISDDDTTDYGNSPRRRRRRHQANESISNIDVRDILGAASGGEDDGPETIARLPLSKSVGSEKSTTTTTTPSNSPPSCRVMTSNPASTSMPHSHKSNLAYLNSDPADRYRPTHSRTLSSSTSISDSTSRNDLASVSTTTLRSSSMANIRASSSSGTFVSTPLTTSPTPKSRKPYNLSSGSSLRGHRSTPAMLTDNARSLSPDIETIIQSTPRPSKTSGGRSFSMSQSGKRSRVTSLRSSRSMKNIHGEVDEFGTFSSSVRLSKSTQDRRPLSSQNPDHSLDYIVQGVWDHQVEEDEEKLRALEKELDGSDSDSSLDLHTPLPHLMARHGLLSSNSKLLSHGESRATTPHCGIDGRPGSTMSVFSNATKSGVIKDERDTPMRRVRHRDKRLLHGGIGLTTGLGWSDSEDEDAPSPLTKRLSTLNLSRRSSASSFFSTASQPHPLSRSYSNGALYDDDGGLGYGFDGPLAEREEEDNLRETSDWAIRQRKITPPSPQWAAWHPKVEVTNMAFTADRIKVLAASDEAVETPPVPTLPTRTAGPSSPSKRCMVNDAFLTLGNPPKKVLTENMYTDNHEISVTHATSTCKGKGKATGK